MNRLPHTCLADVERLSPPADVASPGAAASPGVPTPQVDVRLTEACPRQQGIALGAALQTQIAVAERSLLEYEAFRLHQPWWMPYSLFQYMAQWRARSLLEPEIGEAFPDIRERICGMAEGARTSVDFLYLFHALESASTAAERENPNLAACTAVAASGVRTRDGRPLLAHNFDLVPTASPLLTLREARCPGSLQYLAMSLAPMAGLIDGVNEAGLAITYNYAPTTDTCANRPPISLSIDRALATCHTVTQAIQLLSSTPRGGGALLMLADAQGDIAALELSANCSAVRRPAKRRLLHHSNAYHTPTLRECEMPRTAVYGEDAPAALRGVSIFESALQRDLRMAKRLQTTTAPLDAETVAHLMADHGPDQQPSANTICMHGSHWSTMASVQMFPAERRIRVSYGAACQAEFQDFQL